MLRRIRNCRIYNYYSHQNIIIVIVIVIVIITIIITVISLLLLSRFLTSRHYIYIPVCLPQIT